VKADDCPCVADLIDFAEGRSGADDRRRIEAHLESTHCTYCQSWIDKASGNPAPATGPFRAAALRGKRAPVGDDASWQKQAFLDLEQRLKQLEEE
jgi:hypothetical protein